LGLGIWNFSFMPQTLPPQPLKAAQLIAPHRILQLAAAGLAALALTGLVAWEVLRVTAPPSLTVLSPIDELLISAHEVNLEGSAAEGSAVSVNGAPIAVSADGKFKETINLRTGLNIITITASKKFAKPNVIYRRVVVKE
jgi:hypothetical protein